MMKFSLIALLLTGAIAWLPAQAFRDIATVRLTKTETIGAQDFERSVADFEAKSKQKLDGAAKKKILDAMIDNILFHQAAIEDKIFVNDDEVIKYIKQMYQIRQDADLQRLVQQSGMTMKEVIDKARPVVEANAYLRKKRPDLQNAKFDITDAEIQKRYNAEVRNFVLPPIVRFQDIFMITAGKSGPDVKNIKAKMQQYAQKIKSGGKAAFDDLYAKSGPEKTYFTRELRVVQGDQNSVQALGESFIGKIFALKRSQVSGLLESSQGFHLLYVIENSPARLIGLDEIIPDTQVTSRENIRQVISLERMNELYTTAKNELATALRKRADITIDAKYKW